MAKGLIDLIVDSIFDAEWVGRHGEKLTEKELKLVKLFGRKGKTLRNVYIPKQNGETSEIDVLYLTQKGIFVFESKNYSGWIFGDEKSQYWTVMSPNKQKNRFYNPVKQNRTHLIWLGKYVGEEVPLFSIIVFSERCELKKLEMKSGDIKVIQRDRVYAAVRDIWDRSPDVISEEKLEDLHERLSALTNVDAAIKAAHIENIEKKYKVSPERKPWIPVIEKSSPEEKPWVSVMDKVNLEMNPSEKLGIAPEAPICPKCGSSLILRTARKGNNTGKLFYGCSAFPKCRYIHNVDSVRNM